MAMKKEKTNDPVEIYFDKEVYRVEEARALADALATNLIDPNFDEQLFYEQLGKLGELGYDHQAVVNCMLSRLAFHEALGDNEEYLDQWMKGLKVLDVPVLEIDEAIREARQLKIELAGKSRRVIAETVYQQYFHRADPPTNIVDMITPAQPAESVAI